MKINFVFLDSIKHTKENIDFQIMVYCLMDNHYHLLIKEDENSGDIGSIIKRITCKYAIYFNKKHDREGPVCRGRFKSEPVESDAYLLAVTAYNHQNPLKAGMVNKIENYKFSSYLDYLNKNDSFLDMDWNLGTYAKFLSNLL